MVPVLSLWMPILLAAVLVFAASSVIHMFLGYHSTDFRKLPSEDEVMDALRSFSIPPGDYVIPYAGSTEAMKSPEFQSKSEKGPVAFVTFIEAGMPAMGKSLAQWFVYCLLVSVFAAYVTGHAAGPGADYMTVFQFASTTAFIAYSLGLAQNSIWYHRNWSATLKSMFDGLIYGLLTAGTLGWLWPA